MLENTIKAYRQALDRVLLKTPDDLLALMREHGVREPPCRKALEITFHKTITASMTLPIEYRRASKAWLTARNLHSLDHGDL
jgi:hypothetical protein